MAGGRIRTSTVLLMIAFFGVLALWVSVRPSTLEQSEEVAVRQSTTTTHRTVTRTETPTPTPTPTRTPTPTPSATAKGKGATAPPLAPTPSPTPGEKSPISQVLPHGHSSSQESTPDPQQPAPAAVPH
jgi:hypothetical protein